jgi:competence protein ComEC
MVFLITFSKIEKGGIYMKFKITNLAIILTLIITMVTGVGHTDAATNKLYVHFINVGQGDSIFIRTAANENILIDAGKTGEGPTVVNYLKKQKVTTIDAVISTHPDADHLGGLPLVIQTFTVNSVYAPKVSNNTLAYKNFLLAVKNKHLTIKTAQTGVIIPSKDKATSLKLVAPVRAYSTSDTNDWSAVLLLKYGAKSFLFTGDAEFASENDMLSHKLLGKVDVLKVAHHGSKYSTSSTFLNVIRPTYSVISVGKNSYGHPTAETIKRLQAVKSVIYRTDQKGNIIFSSDGKTLTIATVK